MLPRISNNYPQLKDNIVAQHKQFKFRRSTDETNC